MGFDATTCCFLRYPVSLKADINGSSLDDTYHPGHQENNPKQSHHLEGYLQLARYHLQLV